MRIHSAEIRHVRQFEELKLDLSAPLTVIGGPNGVGKTTLQEAILAAMFARPKAVRDSFVSQFDPDTPPTVALGLSHGENAPTVSLTRHLIDDKGEWKEGATILKGKKQALDKIQEVLPISADAAAVLLWGRQDEMSAVLEAFPTDGHSLLTAATVKGSGPDPKKIIKELEKDIDNARKGERGGQTVGALIQSKNKLQELEDELGRATSADEQLRQHRAQLAQAKTQRDHLQSKLRELANELTGLNKLQKLIDSALKLAATCDEMAEEQAEWDSLEEEIKDAREELKGREQELDHLRVQHRVARDQELAREIAALEKRIKEVEELEAACADLEKVLKSKKRPAAADEQAFHKLQSRRKEACDKTEATGVRYELSALDGPRTLRIAEDGQGERQITLAAGEVYTATVGRVTVEADGLLFRALGKQDISRHKQAEQTASQEIQVLFERFGVENEAGFVALAREQREIKETLETQKNERRVRLAGATAESLRSELDLQQGARTENNMKLSDKEACGMRPLPPAAEIDRWCAERAGRIQTASDHLRTLEEKRVNDADRQIKKKTLETMRTKAREAATAFADADDLHRDASKELREEIHASLERKRHEQGQLNDALLIAANAVADLSGQLKQAQPHRPLDTIQSELQDAREGYDREHVLQQARALLKERIENKIEQLAAHVPLELGERVTRHLARLTGGGAGQVALNRNLAVTHVGENGAAHTWQPQQLSCGERHQAALAVKIAVARALAEASGPIFIILDDSLVSFDPHRRAATEEFLLDLVADGQLQIILLTCHTDWAAGFKERRPDQLNYIELVQCAQYYRLPPAVAAASATGEWNSSPSHNSLSPLGRGPG